MATLTNDQKALLEPFGEIFAGISNQVREMPDADLANLLEAVKRTSTTNCWCYSYDAAQFLRKELETEIYQRKQRVETEPIEVGSAQ